MASSLADDLRWGPAAGLRQAVTVLQYAYPIVLLVFFLAAFTTRSIAASNSNANIAQPTTTGPGGKPLPATDPTRNFVKRAVLDDVTQTQKRVFEWVSLATALTFVGNSVLVITHSLVMKNEHWWAGKSVVVRTARESTARQLTANTARSTSSAPSSSTACSSSRCSTRSPRPPARIWPHGAPPPSSRSPLLRCPSPSTRTRTGSRRPATRAPSCAST
jgi:hypothetical protein